MTIEITMDRMREEAKFKDFKEQVIAKLMETPGKNWRELRKPSPHLGDGSTYQCYETRMGNFTVIIEQRGDGYPSKGLVYNIDLYDEEGRPFHSIEDDESLPIMRLHRVVGSKCRRFKGDTIDRFIRQTEILSSI